MTFTSRVGAVCLFVLSASACLSTEEDEPLSQFAIEGSVRDDDTGDALSGAKVSFVSDVLDEAETRTGGDGRFTMDVDVRDGVSFGTLRAEYPGYRASDAQTIYFDGTARTVDIRLRASGD